MHDRLNWARAACVRVLRPLVRLAMGMGLKYAHLDEILRGLLVEEAERIGSREGTGKPNVSQISMATGLNRKVVTSLVRYDHGELPHTELSAAAKTFTLWFQATSLDAAFRRIPFTAAAGAPSFESLAREATRGDLHHRAVFDELVRLGMAVEDEGHAELLAEAFVPSTDLQTMLAFLGDNTRDHLSAAVANVFPQDSPMLERAVYAQGLSREDCDRIHEDMRRRWDALHSELVQEMTKAVNARKRGGTHRIRVGVYVYHEDWLKEKQAEALATGKPAPTGKKKGKL